MRYRSLVVLVVLLFTADLGAQFTQQARVVMPSCCGGNAVAVSADGNTMILGGYFAVYTYVQAKAAVFIRSAGVWTQQASLVGNDAEPDTHSLGAYVSVAISADGNTALLGSPDDHLWDGATWVFTRSGTTWTQQGPKIVARQPINLTFARQGSSVALSADGNTALIGGPNYKENNSVVPVGAAWIFTRSGGAWTQGQKLTGSDPKYGSLQGTSVALSGDGNTALLGGPEDDDTGAAWVFTRSGSAWTQQGPKLVGSGGATSLSQGSSVALSSDGNTALVGDPNDHPGQYTWLGAAWVFTRSGGVWTQQGNKLVGTGGSGSQSQGSSAALSGDGNIALVGDAEGGAAWVFTRVGGTWSQFGSRLVGSPSPGCDSVALSTDATTAVLGEILSPGAAFIFTSPGNPVPSQLAFVQQPTNTMAGQTITPAVTVRLLNSVGNPVSQAGVTIGLSLSSGTGTLGGTLSQSTNSSGVATFGNLSINLTGAKQLTAASTGLAPAVSGSFSITAAPAITSANHATFLIGWPMTFAVTTTGWPLPALGVTGARPSGVIFTDKGDGTGTLAGVPAAGTAGSYALTVTASNGVGSAANQGFSLSVVAPSLSKLYTLSPCRVLDTRNTPNGPLAGPALQPGATRSFAIPTAPCSVPTNARAVSANVAATGISQPGYLTIFPADVTRPLASSINFMPGQTRSNNAVLPLSSDGTGSISVFAGSAGTVHFILDVNGYFR